MIDRAATVNKRVRESEKFPRIRDAEAELFEEEARLQDKYGREYVKTGVRGATAKGKIGTNRVIVAEPPEADFFTTHVLNKDPSCAAYMPYNEVQYPNIFRPGSDKVSAENLQNSFWMSGFLDRAMRGEDLGETLTKKKKAKKPKKGEPSFIANSVRSKLKEESFIDMSTISAIAGSGGALDLSVKKELLDPADLIIGPVDDLESDPGDSHSEVRTKGSLKGLSNKDLKKALIGMATGPAKRPHLSLSQSQSQSSLARSSLVSVDSSLTGIGQQPPSAGAADKAIIRKFKPYLDTLLTEKDVRLRAQEKKRLEHRQTTVASDELERIFEQQRVENEAARFVQQFWRRYLCIRHWRSLVKAVFCARTIQRFVRGMIARKWIGRWFAIRNKVIVCWQAGIRRVISTARVKRIRAHETACAIKIQRTVRGKLGRVRWRRILRDTAATRVQAAWRGIVARCRFDKLWLNRQVLPIQNITRRMIAMRRFKGVKAELEEAACVIQRQFRGWRACRTLGEALWKREVRYRTEVFLLLTNEEDYAQSSLERLVARLVKGNLRRLAETHVAALQKDYEVVDRIEKDIVMTNQEKESLSPRALIQGWLPELITKLNQYRKDLTQAKLKAVFDSCTEVRKIDDKLDEAMRAIEEGAEVRNRLSLWRDIEYFERRDMVYDKEILMKEKARKQAVSEEARKWKVVFRNPEGKPIKHRKPAGPEKMTYSAGAGVDLLANIGDGKGALQGPAPGTIESIEKTVDKVALQTYLEQVNTYQQLLNPLTQIMQRGLGAGGEGMQATEDLGWGHEGRKLQKALAGVGVGEVEEDELEGLTYAEKMALLGTKLADGKGGRAASRGGGGSPGGLRGQRSVDDHHLKVQFDDEDSDEYDATLATDEGFMPTDSATVDDTATDAYPYPRPAFLAGSPRRGMLSSSMSDLPVGGSGSRSLRPLKVREREARAMKREQRRAARNERGIAALRGAGADGDADYSVLSDAGTAFPDLQKRKKVLGRENKLDSPKFSRKFSSMFAEHGGDSSYSPDNGGDLVGSTSRPGTRERRPPSRSIADILSDARKMTLAAQDREKERTRMARKRERKAGTARSAAIPWALLDELEGEKARFESDCAHAELYHKF